jgi:hypothetical protein
MGASKKKVAHRENGGELLNGKSDWLNHSQNKTTYQSQDRLSGELSKNRCADQALCFDAAVVVQHDDGMWALGLHPDAPIFRNRADAVTRAEGGR